MLKRNFLLDEKFCGFCGFYNERKIFVQKRAVEMLKREKKQTFAIIGLTSKIMLAGSL